MRILIIANTDVALFKFRRELIETLLHKYEVCICLPNGEFVSKLVDMGCKYYPCEFDRHSTNPIAELKQVLFYKRIVKSLQPDVVLTYTVKPNVYAGMVCASMNVPYIANITGLGTAIENGGMMQKFLLALYRYGLRKAKMVFFQNEANLNFMLSKGVLRSAYTLIPGSGVNLSEHVLEKYPESEKPIVLVTIGRIMKEKGADEIIYAAEKIRLKHPDVVFRLIGGFDGDYEKRVQQAVNEGVIEYLGHQSDVHHFLKNAHAIVHPSYHEGMSNVLLEAASCGRPIIATDVPGCRETYQDGVSGISFKPKDGEGLVQAIEKFLSLSYDAKVNMGISGRQKVEKEFDRNIVIEKYVNEIEKVK